MVSLYAGSTRPLGGVEMDAEEEGIAPLVGNIHTRLQWDERVI